MKKFKLTILIGMKVIYQSILSFDDHQQRTYLQKAINDGKDDLDDDLAEVTSRTIGKRKYKKEREKWDNMSIKEYVEKYPDVVICAQIQLSIYDYDLFKGFSDFELKIADGAGEEKRISLLEDYNWNCIPIK